MHLLMLFLDGVGIGKRDSWINPFFAANLPTLKTLLGSQLPSLRNRFVSTPLATLVPLDATLGVSGLPQSGTGQTALFTGVNAAKLIGRHFGPYPHSALRPVIEEKNIFQRLLKAGRRPYFANAFPQRFFDYMNGHQARRSVTTLSCMLSGVPLCRYDELRKGMAISADITNAAWPGLGYPDIKPIEPHEAGRRLAHLTTQYDFVLFEYWITDKTGHSSNLEEAIEVLERFDAMLGGILDNLDKRSTVLITSDHGNIEDMSTKTHTRNPVPLIVTGGDHHLRDELVSFRGDLTCVPSLILKMLSKKQSLSHNPLRTTSSRSKVAG